MRNIMDGVIGWVDIKEEKFSELQATNIETIQNEIWKKNT